MGAAAASQGLVNHVPNVANLNTGNCLACPGISARAVMSSHSCTGDPKLFNHVKIFPRGHHSKRSFACTASSSGSQRKNPDFPRQNKGFSRGRNRQNQERESSESWEDANDLLPSKNGPLLSPSNSPRHQAAATPGQREREIVELFRKVQAQLRERAAVKDEKKAEASSQGQGERGTVDSLLKLLRKHSADQGKKKSGEKYSDIDQPERGSPFEDGRSSSFFESSIIVPEEAAEEPGVPVTRRPPSNFQRRSPVPKVKYQPIYSSEEGADPFPPKSAAERKNPVTEEDHDEEPVSLDEREALDDEPSDPSDGDDAEGEIAGLLSAAEAAADLSSLKTPELRALAKSRGMKGYSKLKKGELVELLRGEGR